MKNFKEYLNANYSISAPKVSSVDKKTIDQVIVEITDGLEMNLQELSRKLEKAETEKWLNNEKVRLEALLTNDDWKSEFQGKIIFARLCSEVLKEDSVRIRECYIDIALTKKPACLIDIIEMFNKM
ncbi:MAG: hypothetical protein BMS9Abin36_2180 [Gammaproteobacteria bacterium]|nr:MAG: hypothetical protein BMS9Abin36_2180 [Gammaproteobacteria bacterium]